MASITGRGLGRWPCFGQGVIRRIRTSESKGVVLLLRPTERGLASACREGHGFESSATLCLWVGLGCAFGRTMLQFKSGRAAITR